MKILKNLVLLSMVTTLTGCGSGNSAKKILNSGRDKNPNGTEITADEFNTFFDGFLKDVENQKTMTQWSAASTKFSSENYSYNYKEQSDSTSEGFSVVNFNKKESYSKSSTKSKEKAQRTVDDKMIDIVRESKDEYLINEKNSYEYSYSNVEYKDDSYKDLRSDKSCETTDEDYWEDLDLFSSLSYTLNSYMGSKTKLLKKNNNTYYIMRTLNLEDVGSSYYTYNSYLNDAYFKLVTNSKGLLTSLYFERVYNYSYTYQSEPVVYNMTQKQAITLEYKARSYKLDTSKGYSCPKEQ